MQGEVDGGNFEAVPSELAGDVWDRIQRQDVLTKLNLVKNLAIGDEAWSAAGREGKEKSAGPSSSTTISAPLTGGIGEGYDEEDDALVYNSDTRVSDLSDKALRSWVATFLLGAPSLGG